MRSAYVICALLGVTIGSLALADNGAAQVATDAKVSKPPTVFSSSPVESPKNVSNGTEPDTTTAVPATNTTTTVIPTNKPDKTTTKPITTPLTTTTSATPSTAITNATTHAPITTTPTKPTTTPATTPKTTTSIPTVPTAVPTGGPHTTAVPSKPPPPIPSKDRQFDGLSFFGGIILATCLMAIAAFSWKFYRQCNEGNYRTL